MDRPKPRGRQDLFYQDVTDGGVLFDPAAERMYVLNATAAFVWISCDGSRAADQIALELRESLGERAPDAGSLLKDVRKSLDDFRKQGLLTGP